MKLFVLSFLIINIMTYSLRGMNSPVKDLVTQYKHETLKKDPDGWVWDEAQARHDIAVIKLKKISYAASLPGKFEIICQAGENTLNRIQILITVKRAQKASFPKLRVVHDITRESVDIFNALDGYCDAYQAFDCCLVLSPDNFMRSEIDAQFLEDKYRKEASSLSP